MDAPKTATVTTRVERQPRLRTLSEPVGLEIIHTGVFRLTSDDPGTTFSLNRPMPTRPTFGQ